MYYGNHQSRLNQFPGERNNFQTLRRNRVLALQKRERSPEVRVVKFRKVDKVTEQLGEQRLATYPDTGDHFMEGEVLVPSAGKHEKTLQPLQDNENHGNEGNPEPKEDDEGGYSVITTSAFLKTKASRQRRFSWTEEADR